MKGHTCEAVHTTIDRLLLMDYVHAGDENDLKR